MGVAPNRTLKEMLCLVSACTCAKFANSRGKKEWGVVLGAHAGVIESFWGVNIVIVCLCVCVQANIL